VDIPKGDPTEVAARYWDKFDEQGQTNMVGRYRSIEIPEAWARQLRPFEPTEPLQRQVLERGRSGRPTRTEPLPIGNERAVQRAAMAKVTGGDLIEQIKNLPERGGSAWLQVPEGEIYARKGQRYGIGPTIELADLKFTADTRGQGAFSDYLKQV